MTNSNKIKCFKDDNHKKWVRFLEKMREKDRAEINREASRERNRKYIKLGSESISIGNGIKFRLYHYAKKDGTYFYSYSIEHNRR